MWILLQAKTDLKDGAAPVWVNLEHMLAVGFVELPRHLGSWAAVSLVDGTKVYIQEKSDIESVRRWIESHRVREL